MLTHGCCVRIPSFLSFYTPLALNISCIEICNSLSAFLSLYLVTETRNSLPFCEGGGFVFAMVGKENFKTEDLNLCFEKLMMIGGGKVKMEGTVITDWKDIPMELLLQILTLVDDQTVIISSGVCRGWRDAICLGLTRLSLSWYMLCPLSLSF